MDYYSGSFKDLLVFHFQALRIVGRVVLFLWCFSCDLGHWRSDPKVISNLSLLWSFTHQVSFRYLIPNWISLVSYRIKFYFNISFLIQKLYLENRFSIVVSCDLYLGRSDPTYSPNLRYLVYPHTRIHSNISFLTEVIFGNLDVRPRHNIFL